MDECPSSSGSVASRTGCILSYGGNTADVVINYVLLVINVTWCAIALSFHSADIEKRIKLRRFAICCLVFGE